MQSWIFLLRPVANLMIQRSNGDKRILSSAALQVILSINLPETGNQKKAAAEPAAAFFAVSP